MTEQFESLQDRGQNTFKGLEVFDLAPEVESVDMHGAEFTALCPITGQPDYYEVDISFVAFKGIESKSLKLYLQQYRQRGAFCETLAAEVLKDIVEALVDPFTVRVTLKQTSRGGISITAHAEYDAIHAPKAPE